MKNKNLFLTIVAIICFATTIYAQNNYSLAFDGVDDYVELGNVTGFNPNLSISLEVVFRWDGPNGVTNHEWLLQFAQSGPGNASIIVLDNGMIMAQSSQCNCIADSQVYSYPLVQGQWYQANFSYDVVSGAMKLWLNGVLVQSKIKPFTSYYAVNNTPSRIGNYHFNSYHFKGRVASAQISNSVIVPVTIGICPTPITAQTLAYYKIEEGSGSVTMDQSTHGNNGSLMNGVLWSTDVPTYCIPPTATTSYNYCQNASATQLAATGSNLLWYNLPVGGVGSSTAPIPSTSTVGLTHYYVSQTVSNCESSRTDIYVLIDPCTGIQNNENGISIITYPNPIKNELNIVISNYNKKRSFEIFNSVGQIIYKGNMIDKTVLNTSNFASGVYLIKIESGNGFEFKKFIKE